MKVRLISYKVPFEEDENFLLDDIESYLEDLESEHLLVESFQYLPMKLKHIIKIPVNQQRLLPLVIDEPFAYNYLKILPIRENESEILRGGNSYYYIKGARWISREAVELELKLDTLNTLGTPSKNYYQFDKKTLILREHKNRLQEWSERKYFKVDKVSEGITPLLYNKGKSVLRVGGNEGDIKQYYLVYKNNLASTDPNNIVRAYLTFDNAENTMNEIPLYYKGITRPITNSKILNGIYYYFVHSGSDYSIDLTTGETTTTISITNANFLRFYAENGKITALKCRNLTSGIEITKYTNVDSVMPPLNSIMYYSNTIKDNPSKIKNFPSQVITASGTREGFMIPYNKLDRSDSKIIKIIKLPYSPLGFFSVSGSQHLNYEDDVYSFDENERMLYVLDSSKILKNQLEVNERITNMRPIALTNIDPNAERNMQNEPKLYHSDFGFKKIVYDSFSLMLKGEEITPLGFTQYPLHIDYYTSTTINSRFAFKLNESYFTESVEDYPFILYINRNNEMTIYNSEYINYIKNGFNYDKKKQERQLLTSSLTAGIGIAGAIGSALLSPTGIGGGVAVGLASSSVNTLINTIKGNIESESNIEQKLQQLQAQAVNVYGADDVDILDLYTNNKAYLTTYECSDEVKSMLFDLFYYYGYKCNYRGIPNLNTRYWFNYIQAEVNLTEVKAFIESDIIQDLKDKYKLGVTIHHRHNYIYDLEQEKENWEVELING